MKGVVKLLLSFLFHLFGILNKKNERARTIMLPIRQSIAYLYPNKSYKNPPRIGPSIPPAAIAAPYKPEVLWLSCSFSVMLLSERKASIISGRVVIMIIGAPKLAKKKPKITSSKSLKVINELNYS